MHSEYTSLGQNASQPDAAAALLGDTVRFSVSVKTINVWVMLEWRLWIHSKCVYTIKFFLGARDGKGGGVGKTSFSRKVQNPIVNFFRQFPYIATFLTIQKIYKKITKISIYFSIFWPAMPWGTPPLRSTKINFFTHTSKDTVSTSLTFPSNSRVFLIYDKKDKKQDNFEFLADFRVFLGYVKCLILNWTENQ